VPHVRPSVHGPKTMFSNDFTLGLDCAVERFLRAQRKAFEGLRPPLSSHVRCGERWAPARGWGFAHSSSPVATQTYPAYPEIALIQSQHTCSSK
jgi:hypothetical protein